MFIFNLLVLTQDTRSILGPLFFLIYINDLSKVSELVDLVKVIAVKISLGKRFRATQEHFKVR